MGWPKNVSYAALELHIMRIAIRNRNQATQSNEIWQIATNTEGTNNNKSTLFSYCFSLCVWGFVIDIFVGDQNRNQMNCQTSNYSQIANIYFGIDVIPETKCVTNLSHSSMSGNNARKKYGKNRRQKFGENNRKMHTEQFLEEK